MGDHMWNGMSEKCSTKQRYLLYKRPKNLTELLLSKEDRYVAGRLIKAFVQSIPFYLFRIFPIQKNKIVFTTIEGTCGYMCNPKYIAGELIKRGLAKEYDLVWLCDDTTKQFPKEIRVVKNTLFNRAYELTTAGWWIDDSRKQLEVRKRNGQKYIQTWHAKLGFKPTSLDRGKSFTKIAYLVSKHDSDMVDYWLSNSDWYDKTLLRGSLYRGSTLRTGSPRCDVLVRAKRDEEYKRKVRKKIIEKYICKVPSENRRGALCRSGKPLKPEANANAADISMERNSDSRNIRFVMYAPTFRGGSQQTDRSVEAETGGLDFDRLVKNLEKRFPGKWYVLLRLHPQLTVRGIRISRAKGDLRESDKESISFTGNKEAADVDERLIDVSHADDMYEILAGCDAFITDYSSAAFDAMVMKIPIFLYCTDYQEYEKERGSLLWDLRTLPFPLAEDNKELTENIAGFNEEKYIKSVDKLMSDTGMAEDGKASKRVVDFILKDEQIPKRA